MSHIWAIPNYDIIIQIADILMLLYLEFSMSLK